MLIEKKWKQVFDGNDKTQVIIQKVDDGIFGVGVERRPAPEQPWEYQGELIATAPSFMDAVTVAEQTASYVLA